MANYVFKQFCAELDGDSLDHLLEIVNRPTGDGDMLEEDSESDESDSDEEQAALMEGAEDEDDDDLE